MNLLARGMAWLTEQGQRHLSATVMYIRGLHEVEIAATIGRTTFEQADDYGVIHRIESRDYLISADALVLGGSKTLPQAGDRIREATTNGTLTYELLAPGGEPPWRYSDPQRTTIRLHTKQVNTE